MDIFKLNFLFKIFFKSSHSFKLKLFVDIFKPLPDLLPSCFIHIAYPKGVKYSSTRSIGIIFLYSSP